MNAWLWVGLGVFLYLINSSPPYQRWTLSRLRRKGISKPEQQLARRVKMLNILASVYILAGIALWISQI